MTLGVIGATAANAAAIAQVASSRGIRVTTGWGSRPPDWIIVASVDERHEALQRYRLPAFRAIEVPEIARDGALDRHVVATAVARMAELGPFRLVLSPLGLRLTRWLMPRIMAALERALSTDAPATDLARRLKAKKAAAKAAEREAKLRERAKSDTPDEARRRAERKAQRKAARRAESSLVSNPTRLGRTQ
jgi:hypothetical protein